MMNRLEEADSEWLVPAGYPTFAHLRRLMGPHGLYEHARYRRPRLNHGYTVDDNARALVVTAGNDDQILGTCLDFVLAAGEGAGWLNRMNVDGHWSETSEDAQGRAIWGLGVVAGTGLGSPQVCRAVELASRRPLAAVRAVAYSVLGAVEMVDRLAGPGGRILDRFRPLRPRVGPWRWPEDRLTYDNARIPQAMMMAGRTLGDPAMVDDGLMLLEWLVGIESAGGLFAFTPVGGRGPGESGPAFDQQPIEAWAMVDACLVAAGITDDDRWRAWAERAIKWFWGFNHAGGVLIDPRDGAGFDGLHADGINRNAGAESTLAALGAHHTWAAHRTAAATMGAPG